MNIKRSLSFKALTLLFVAFCSFNSSAQTNLTDNGNQDEIRALEKAKKENVKEMEAFEVFTNNFKHSKNALAKAMPLPDTSCIVTIPVVVHVFHPNGVTGVPLSQIAYAINDLNITFSGQDADYGTVNAAFSGVKSYTKIRFALAKIDPNGNSTNGIVYYKDKQVGYANSPMWDNEISTIAWDNYKYFNVYVMNDLFGNGVTNNSGFCFYPNSGMTAAGRARMVYNYSYLGFGGASFNNLEFNQTFTHECGHYLNLLHTFEGTNCSAAGDLCADTPPTAVAGAGCNATQCTALINGENYMDYNATCYKNFTMDQNTRMEAALMHPARITQWQYDNLVATGILNSASTNSCVNASPFFSFSKTQLFEDILNTGSIATPPVIIYACGGAQFASTAQTLVQGTDYTISNLPSGLSTSLVTSGNGKTATLTLMGQAVSHGSVNTLSNINFAFTNAAVVGGSVTAITNYSNTLKIKFYDPWGLTCSNAINISATSSATLATLQTIGSVPKNYGLRYSAGNYYLENYGRGIITTASNSDNIVFLPAGTLIGPASVWRTGGNSGVLYSSSHNALDGTTGFVGFRMQIGNDYYYGYMTIQVSSTSGVTLIEYVYSNKPNEPVTAGTNCLNLGLSRIELSDPFKIYPNPSSKTIHIQNFGGNAISDLVIIDVTGRKVLEQKENISEIDIQHLNKGVYQILITSEGKMHPCKFIKQ